jgi:hypothetical protein
MVITDGNSFASKVAELATINLVTDEKHHSLPSAPQLSFLFKEGVEVVGAERLLSYASSFLYSRSTGYKLGILHSLVFFCTRHRLY